MAKIVKILKIYFSDYKKISEIIATLGLTMIFLGVLTSPIVSFANPEPVRSVEIPSTTLSYENKEEGAWKITKSAKWISKGKANLNIKIDTLAKRQKTNADIILVLDTSGSMTGKKIEKVKEDVNELIEDLVQMDSKIALITFNDNSNIITNFTNDLTLLIENINSINPTGETNYYKALINVDNILKSYQKQEERECIVLFLTDGGKTTDTLNEVAQYNYLKTTYPYITINGIQYELGNESYEAIKKISDNQYNATIDTLNKLLYKITIPTIKYKTLKITSNIKSEYFNIKNISSYNVNYGNINIKNNQIEWDLNNLPSGTEASLTITANLNEELMDLGGTYSISEGLYVQYEIDKAKANEKTTLTPILEHNHLTINDANNSSDSISDNQ